MRIKEAVARGAPVEITVNGTVLTCHGGESLASALLAGGIRTFRHSPRSGMPRSAFCHMGVCQECLVTVDGRRITSCMTAVKAGMVVRLDGLADRQP